MYSELKELGRLRTQQAQDQAVRELGFEAATQKRTDEANQRRILSAAPPTSFDMPGDYKFGSKVITESPDPVRSVPTPTSTAAANSRKAHSALQKKAPAPAEPAEPERTHLWHAEGSTNVNTPYGESVGNAFGLIRDLIVGRTNPHAEAETKRVEKLRAQDAARAGQTPAATAQATKQAPQGAPTANQYDKPTPYDPVIQKAAQEAGIDPVMFKRLIGSESSFSPTATSPRGESFGYGIAQIAAVHGLSKEQMADPNVALPFAAKLLSKYIAESGGDVKEGVLRYKGAVSEAGRSSMSQVYDSKIAGTGAPTGAPTGQPQQAAPKQPDTLFSGMGPGGSPRMLQEQIELGKFQYQQLNQMLQHSSPEQQAKLIPQRDALVADIRAKQAYMLAAQSDANPQALGQLVAMTGAQAARTQDGRFVLVDQGGKAVSPAMTGGQLGAYLFRAVDERAKAAQAEMQGKIALERAKAEAKAQGDLAVQGMTTADMERLKAMFKFYEEQNKPGETRAIADPMKGGITFYNSRQPGPAAAPNTVLPQ